MPTMPILSISKQKRLILYVSTQIREMKNFNTNKIFNRLCEKL